jgi:hypothetical protein
MDKTRPFVVTADYRPAHADASTQRLRHALTTPPTQLSLL